ncbi:hypothetical protein LZD49_32000 [Dyadobacter sp. CY261]|uniref:glycosyl transferase family 90 n=1 Tax=Dyadobacter sp. CY261 TaxID=2907203 RepID=UPI001F270F12|nr:glycosyl transferase family 90 [Dyadobacter sp. CY261]MCF0075151.1 hypothetical protein [Dyadobacter sp. CY261]
MNLSAFLIEVQRNKTLYYIKNALRQMVPDAVLARQFENRLAALSKFSGEQIWERVNYYNSLETVTKPDPSAIMLSKIREIKAPSAYIFDSMEYTRYFPDYLKALFRFGDIVDVAETPAIQKSRPVSGDKRNAVLLNLDKKRHFLFIQDPFRFENKKEMLIGRGAVTQPHRIAFMNRYFGHPALNLGQVNRQGGNPAWIVPKMSIYEHLKYKFILSLEGNDVATNLKWIMSSNSVAVMARPKYETWFMEGSLVPNYHYIQIQDDYSDLLQVLDYYIAHPKETQQIAENANRYVQQFSNQQKEDLISLLVLEKYFYYTSQISTIRV